MKTDLPRYLDFWDSVFRIYPNGIRSRRAVPSVPTGRAAGGGGVRGDIRYFSRHSALRLRDALLSSSLPVESRAVSLGITLTLPWQIVPCMISSAIEADYRIVFNRFCVAFRRRFPSSAAIFRHELQRRRAPHCHIVFFLSRFDFDLKSRGRSANISVLRDLIFSLWLRALSGSQVDFVGDSPFRYRYSVNLSAFQKRGVVVSCLHNTIAQYRYLADHASKHKKSQLGYHGKQWGFINRRLIVSESFDFAELRSPSDRVSFVRHIGKVIRFRVPDFKSRQKFRLKHQKLVSSHSVLPAHRLPDNLFCCKLSSPLASRSVVFVKSCTSKALIDWLNGERVKGFLI